MSRVVLITGVSRDLGARLARSLAADGEHTVIGLDLTPPKRDLDRVTFVRADLRSPAVTGVVDRYGVDTVVHCGWREAEGVSTAAAKEANILGTMQLVAACQQSPDVRKVVLRSTGQVYGASPLDPARFAETTIPRQAPRDGPARDALEMESLVCGLAQRRSDVIVTVLRLADLMGRDVDSALTRWLARPLVPRPLGFNARLQFLHPVDAVRALSTVIGQDVSGTFNVAAADSVTLTQVLRILGRPAVGLWRDAPGLQALARRAKIISYSNEQLRDITWGRLLDASAFCEETGFEPHYSSRRALEEFAAFAPPGPVRAEQIDRLLAQLTRLVSPVAAASLGAPSRRRSNDE